MSSEITPAPSITSTPPIPVRFGDFVFDPRRRLLRRGDTEIALPPRVLGVLELLVARAGEVVARQELIDAVWRDAFVTDTSLAEAVSYLRQALGDDSQAPRYIQTVHRRGYRLVAPLAELSPPAPAPALRPAADPGASETSRGVDAPIEALRPSIANELLPWSVAIIAFIAALSAVWYATNERPVKVPILTLPIELNSGEQFDTRAPALAVSPSGSTVAWSACRNGKCQLYVRDLENLRSRALPGTEGAAAPFFSPDELWIGFFADGKLKKVFVRGGGAVTITEASQPFGAAWLDEGTIVFAPSGAGGLMRVDHNGGAASALTIPSAASGEVSHAYPSRAPDGEGVIFVIRTSPVPSGQGRLALLPHTRSLQTGWRVLIDRVDIGAAVGSEFLAFVRDGGLSAIRYDPVSQTTVGAPQVLEEPSQSVVPRHLALSGSGAIATVGVHWIYPSEPSAPAWEWNRTGQKIAEGLAALEQATLSPDGRHVAGVDRESLADIWIVDVERGTRVRLTHAAPNACPAWNADSSTVFYASRQQGAYEIWSRGSNGADDAKRILGKPDRHLFPSSVSLSGDVAFQETGGASRSDVGVLSGTSVRMIAQTPFDETAPAISPDGTMVAYQSDESSRWEIILTRLTDGKRTVVSRNGGAKPFWSRDGRHLFFQQDDTLMSGEIDASVEGTGTPIVVGRLNGALPVGIAPSGAVLLHRPADPHLRADTATVTVNWIEHLRRTLLPPLPSTPR